MAQQCTVCAHPDKKEIEKKLVEGKAHQAIGRAYKDLNSQAIRRHARKHLPRRLVLAQKRKQASHNETIMDHLNGIVSDTKNILDEAIERGDSKLALKAIKESRNNMELLSKIAVKQAEYAQQDRKVESREEDAKVSEGLKSLTEPELKALIFLQSKVKAADSNYVADEKARMVIQHVNSSATGYPSTDTDITEGTTKTKNNSSAGGPPEEPGPDTLGGDGDVGPDSGRRQNSLSQDKSPKNEDDLQLDDLRLEDLGGDDKVDDELDSFEPYVPDNPKKNIIPGGD